MLEAEPQLLSIEMDKISLPEIMGHLKDHICPSNVMHLHWLRPGKDLAEGLMLLVDDTSCLMMADHIREGQVADIYVEDVSIEHDEVVLEEEQTRIQEQRTKAERWQGTICPNIFKKLKLNIERSGKCFVLWNGADGFEVKENEKRRYTVNLERKTCSCRYWQLSGLPCCHAISAIYTASKKLDDYIAPCFSIKEYMKTYEHCLQPVEGQERWPVSDMPRPHPPAYVRKPGRPKTQRTREPGEAPKGTKLSRVGVKMRCSLCHRHT